MPLDLAKGFEDMSALEKAQSVPYMRQRFGEHFRLTNPAISDSELAGGFGPVTTCDFLRLGGRIFRFWASSDAPALIQRSVSDDLGAWESLVTDEQAVADSQIDPDGVELAESRDAELDGGNVEALDEGEFRRRTDGSE